MDLGRVKLNFIGLEQRNKTTVLKLHSYSTVVELMPCAVIINEEFSCLRLEQIWKPSARYCTENEILGHSALNGMSLLNSSPQSSENPAEDKVERI